MMLTDHAPNLLFSVGKYVCHHSVVTRENAYHVGARTFNTIGDVIEYFTEHPLGEMTLKEEVGIIDSYFNAIPSSLSLLSSGILRVLWWPILT